MLQAHSDVLGLALPIPPGVLAAGMPEGGEAMGKMTKSAGNKNNTGGTTKLSPKQANLTTAPRGR